MRWNVEGADAQTGVEQSWVFDADSEREAEKKARKRGILVASVRKQIPPTPPAAINNAGALNSMIGSALRTSNGNGNSKDYAQPIVPVAATLASGTAGVATHVRTPAYAPSYTSLRVCSGILLVFAILGYGLGAMLFVLTATGDAAPPDGMLGKLVAIAPAVGCLVGGVVLQTLSSAASALRDVARRLA